MREGISLFLILLLSAAISARTDFSDQIIVTSADLINGVIADIGKAGVAYRVYGLAAAYANEQYQAQLDKIAVTDGNVTIKLTELRDPNSQDLFLSETNFVVGPVTVHDPNPAISLIGEPGTPRLPFTIYLVPASVAPFAVVDAVTLRSRPDFDSNSYNGWNVPAVTILSADAYFSLSQFELGGSVLQAAINPYGYDFDNGLSILDVTPDNARNSYVSVLGPIATIMNTNLVTPSRFKFKYSPNLMHSGPITPNATVSISSPNWLNIANSYETSWVSYNNEFDTKFDFGKDTLISFRLSASNIKGNEDIKVIINTESGESKVWTYDKYSTKDINDQMKGKSFELIAYAQYPSVPTTYPRYLVKVSAVSNLSPASTLSSLLVLFYLIKL